MSTYTETKNLKRNYRRAVIFSIVLTFAVIGFIVWQIWK